MADIVGSLFGLSVPELQEQRRQQQLVENQNYANIMAKSSPAPGRTYNQVMLGHSSISCQKNVFVRSRTEINPLLLVLVLTYCLCIDNKTSSSALTVWT